jgi:hypothetical protein
MKKIIEAADLEDVGVRNGGALVLGRSLEESGSMRRRGRPGVAFPFPGWLSKHRRRFPTTDGTACIDENIEKNRGGKYAGISSCSPTCVHALTNCILSVKNKKKNRWDKNRVHCIDKKFEIRTDQHNHVFCTHKKSSRIVLYQ